MSSGTRDGAELSALQDLLDTHGADASRWPAGAEARFALLLRSDEGAKRALAEARALDALLARAPEVSPTKRASLADRIVAEAIALRVREEARPRAEVIGLASRRSPPRSTGTLLRPKWQAAVVLAASLMLGVFAGISGQVTSPWDNVTAMIGLGADSDGLSLALNQAVDTTGEEDPL